MPYDPVDKIRQGGVAEVKVKGEGACLAADGHVGRFARQRPRRNGAARRLEREAAHMALGGVGHVLVHIPSRHPHKQQQVHKSQSCTAQNNLISMRIASLAYISHKEACAFRKPNLARLQLWQKGHVWCTR